MQVLKCSHSFNRRSKRDYVVACKVLKEMPDGRLKIRMTHDRYGVKLETGPIRYVEKDRVIDATPNMVKHFE